MAGNDGDMGDQQASGPSISGGEDITGTKPNVFFILVDDMGYGDIGYQSTDLSSLTPNLDALMSGGRKVWPGCASGRDGIGTCTAWFEMVVENVCHSELSPPFPLEPISLPLHRAVPRYPGAPFPLIYDSCCDRDICCLSRFV